MAFDDFLLDESLVNGVKVVRGLFTDNLLRNGVPFGLLVAGVDVTGVLVDECFVWDNDVLEDGDLLVDVLGGGDLLVDESLTVEDVFNGLLVDCLLVDGVLDDCSGADDVLTAEVLNSLTDLNLSMETVRSPILTAVALLSGTI